jgi:adenosine kinase
MSVLISGSIAYDNILSFPGKFSDHIIAESLDHINLTFLASSMARYFGGCAANIAYSLKMLGGDPIVYGAVGSDGSDYLARFDQLGISTAIAKLEDTFSAQCFITTDSTGSQITTFFPGAMALAEQAPFPQGADIDIALLGPDGLAAMVKRRSELVERGIPFIYDIGQSASQFPGPEICSFLHAAPIIAASRYEMELITQKTSYKIADLTALGKTVIVTDGALGASVYTPEGSLSVPAVKVDTVDPVGAGDAFRGGLLFGMTRNLGWETSMRLGAVMSSFKVEARGAQNYHATVSEIISRFEKAYGEAVALP